MYQVVNGCGDSNDESELSELAKIAKSDGIEISCVASEGNIHPILRTVPSENGFRLIALGKKEVKDALGCLKPISDLFSSENRQLAATT